MPKNSRQQALNIREVIPTEKVREAIRDLTHAIAARFDFAKGEAALVGVQTRGAILAERIAAAIRNEKGINVPVGALDITLYRDDFSTSAIQPVIGETHLDFDIDDKDIVL